MNININKR